MSSLCIASVKNLDHSVTEKDLYELFQHLDPSGVYVSKQIGRATFGFIQFPSAEKLQAACQVTGLEFVGGRKLMVDRSTRTTPVFGSSSFPRSIMSHGTNVAAAPVAATPKLQPQQENRASEATAVARRSSLKASHWLGFASAFGSWYDLPEDFEHPDRNFNQIETADGEKPSYSFPYEEDSESADEEEHNGSGTPAQ